MKIYDGTAVTGVEDAPPVTSMCAHGERLFLTDADGDAVWFSDDFDPANWNVSLSEAGFIDFGGAGGRVLKAVSFGGYVYVFKSYGISKVYAYGEQNSFSASEIFVSSGKIRGDSITVCGNCILFSRPTGCTASTACPRREFPTRTQTFSICLTNASRARITTAKHTFR